MDGWTGIWLALLLLTLPLRWTGAFLLAVLLHELCHGLAVYLLGGKILELRATPTGMVMAVSELSPVREMLCAFAGPAGSFTLLLFLSVFPELALCGFVHGAYNLLPVYPLDGGRCLKCLIALLFSQQKSERVFRLLQIPLLIILSGAGIFLTFRLKWGILPLLFSFRLAYSGFQEILLALRPFRRYNRATIIKEVLL